MSSTSFALGSGTIKVRLYPAETKFLLFIAERGGRVDFDKEKCEANVNARIASLVRLGVLSETPIIGRGSRCVWYDLTDMGKNILTQIEKR